MPRQGPAGAPARGRDSSVSARTWIGPHGLWYGLHIGPYRSAQTRIPGMAGKLLVHFALAVKRRNERKRLAGWNRWLAAPADIGRLLHELPIKALDLVGIAR